MPYKGDSRHAKLAIIGEAAIAWYALVDKSTVDQLNNKQVTLLLYYSQTVNYQVLHNHIDWPTNV